MFAKSFFFFEIIIIITPAGQIVVNRDVLGLGICQYFTHSTCPRPKNAKPCDVTIFCQYFGQKPKMLAQKFKALKKTVFGVFVDEKCQQFVDLTIVKPFYLIRMSVLVLVFGSYSFTNIRQHCCLSICSYFGLDQF